MKRIKNILVIASALAITLTWFTFVDAQQESFHAMAPEKCWAYSFWDTPGQYDPNSKNETERLLAEPDVQAFTADLIKRIGLVGPAMMTDRSPDQQKLIRSFAPKITNVILQRSGCFCLQDVMPRDDGQVGVKAFMCLDAGSDAKSLASELSQLVSNPEQDPQKVTLAGLEFNRFLVSEEPKVELLIGASPSTLIVGIGEDTLSDAMDRIRIAKTPSWMASLKSNQNTKRLTNFSYFSVKKMRDTLVSFGPPQAMTTLNKLGLGNVDSVETSTGLTAERAFSRLFIKLDGRPEGLLDLYSQNGLQLEDLKQIPKDSLFASGFSLDIKRVFNLLQSTISDLTGRDEVGQAIEDFKQATGVDFKTQIVDNLGDSWTIYNGTGDGWGSGATLTGSVKSSEELSEAINTLLKKVIIETGGSRFGPKFTKRVVGDSELFTMQVQGMAFPFQPSWALSDNRIIVGLYPQAVEIGLKQSTDAPLVDQAKLYQLKTAFSKGQSESKLIAFGYGDSKSQFPFAYGYTQMIMTVGQSAVDEMELPPKSATAISELISGVRLPPARSIYEHLGPSWSTARQTEFGIELESTHTIPVPDVGYVAPVAVGTLLPAVMQVRGAAQRITSANNLRQLTLCVHNFESAYQKFPARYTIDENDKKLLSWRVHMLPFLEQSNLYDSFKLDEPWDSEHNKKLIAKMPLVFRSPVSKAKPGMTVYRSIGGEAAIIKAPKKPNSKASDIGFGQVVDGSSNTALFIETSDELAQVWTQPGEGVTAEDIEAIFGGYSGGTNVAMGDASIQFMTDQVSKANLKYVMQRNDGHVIDEREVFEQPKRNRRRRSYNGREEKVSVDPFFVIDGGDVELTIGNMLSPEENAEIEREKKLLRIRLIGLACHSYESANRSFPLAYTTDPEGKPLLSWRVQLLPFLEENDLYMQFKLDEPWDSEHNKALIEKMPDIYDMGGKGLGVGKTTVRAMGGKQGIFPAPIRGQRRQGIGFSSISDGTSNTLMLVNVPKELAVEWTKPSEFDPDDEEIKLILANGFTATLADGSMPKFPNSTTVDEFKIMWTRAGGEIVNPDEISNRRPK